MENRQIKFRAWIKKDNIGKPLMFYQGEQYLQSFLRRCVFFSNDEGRDHEKYGDYQLLLSTGQKDKNGKEIFEGDILNDGILVIWREDLSSFALRKINWMHDHYFGEAVDAGQTEIKGNIFENPELLAGGVVLNSKTSTEPSK